MKKFLLLLFLCIPAFAYPAPNFSTAKNQLIKIYKDNPSQKEFYCGCNFSWEGKKSFIDLASCGYQIRKNEIRASRIEWEHVMPAYNFGNQLLCWQEGGRKNCAKIPEFNVMEGDLHNLQPSIGEINADRSNFGYSQWTNQFNQYGKCNAVTDFKGRKFQPRPAIRGTIARTYFYMAYRYNIRLSKQDVQLMEAWNKTYPPDQWECKRNLIIAEIQGNDNPFITERCNY